LNPEVCLRHASNKSKSTCNREQHNDEVDVDDESVESDVEVKTSVPGADKDTSEVLGLLTKASEASDAFSDDPELKTQIGNTITYFTRKHVAKV